jgi:hypothetical protein
MPQRNYSAASLRINELDFSSVLYARLSVLASSWARCHQDWPQTQPGSFGRSLDRSFPGQHLLPGKLHDQA